MIIVTTPIREEVKEVVNTIPRKLFGGLSDGAYVVGSFVGETARGIASVPTALVGGLWQGLKGQKSAESSAE